MDSFSFDEFLSKYRNSVYIILIGLVLILSGVFIFKSGVLTSETKVEVLNATTTSQETLQITAEVAGEVINPGVYKLPSGSRVEDLLIVSGGLSANADRDFVERNVNRATKILDGQKLYIPKLGEQSNVLSARTNGGDQTVSQTFLTDNGKTVNINTASLSELDTLPGIGQTYGQKIIEHRPYSNVQELLSKEVLTKSVYEKIKSKISI